MCLAVFLAEAVFESADVLVVSLIPRPSHRPVFDRLQYAKLDGGKAWERGQVVVTMLWESFEWPAAAVLTENCIGVIDNC